MKVPTPEVQGEGSYILFRRPTYGERKTIRAEVEPLEGDALNTYMLDFALGRLDSWNWTDEHGTELEIPKSEADIDDFRDEEIAVMLLTGFKALKGLLTWNEEDRKNSSAA